MSSTRLLVKVETSWIETTSEGTKALPNAEEGFRECSGEWGWDGAVCIGRRLCYLM